MTRAAAPRLPPPPLDATVKAPESQVFAFGDAHGGFAEDVRRHMGIVSYGRHGSIQALDYAQRQAQVKGHFGRACYRNNP